MPYDQQQLRAIYYRTDGYCHICHCKLSLTNYGAAGKRGAWEVEHSRARANGGTDHGNNLKPACVLCNREKSDYTTRTARAWNGTTRAPLSKAKKQQIRKENADLGTAVGLLVGAVGGPLGMAAGAAIGRALGKSIRPPKV